MQLKTFPLLYAVLLFALQPTDANNRNNYSSLNNYHLHFKNNPQLIINYYGHQSKPFNSDTDGDGVEDFYDLDDDNDGILDTEEGDDTVDTDGDGIPDYLDTDADGDGCLDAKEAGFTDADNDGTVDGTGINADGIVTGSDGYTTPNDTNNNGIPDYIESNYYGVCLPDTDGDGIDDSVDLDDDNDGIHDTYEGDDGIDHDNDGIPDYKDIDSDGDGCNDAREAGFTDNNNDGIVDGTGIAADGTVVGSDGYTTPIDADNNGIPDYRDANYNGVCALAINVGPDFAVCQGDTIQLTGVTASNFNSIYWNTSGDGVFNNSFTLNPVYTPGLIDITSGGVKLTAIVSGVSQNTASDSLIVTILQNDFLNLISNNDNQIVCSSDPITEIKYETNATEISFVGLPNGVNASLINNIVTISGSPNQVTNQTVYNYEIITAVNACASAAIEGQITVNPNDTIMLTSAIGTNNQFNKCPGAAIDPIIYTFGGSANSASVTWNTPNGQPSGVTFDPATLTISGTISNAISTNTTYSYTITTGGSLCYTASANGSINVNPQCEAQIELNGTVTAKNNQIKDVATPTDAQDVATKAYVDNVLTNLGVLSDDFTGLSDMVQQLQQIINQLQQEVNDLKEQLNNSKK